MAKDDKPVFQRFLDYELDAQNVEAEMARVCIDMEFNSTAQRGSFLGFDADLFNAYYCGDLSIASLLTRMLVRTHQRADRGC